MFRELQVFQYDSSFSRVQGESWGRDDTKQVTRIGLISRVKVFELYPQQWIHKSKNTSLPVPTMKITCSLFKQGE